MSVRPSVRPVCLMVCPRGVLLLIKLTLSAFLSCLSTKAHFNFNSGSQGNWQEIIICRPLLVLMSFVLLLFPCCLFMFSHSIFHPLFQKKNKAPKKKKKKKTGIASSKNNPQKFKFKKSETLPSKKKKSSRAAARGKIGVKVAQK